MDRIIIQDLTVYARHGVYAEENILGQQFLVSVTIETDLSRAGQSDDLKDSIDYGKICHFVTQYMQQHTFRLIESVAEHLSQELLIQYKQIKKIKVKVKKPWAPIGLPIKNVSVEIERERHIAYIAFGSNMGDKQAYIKQGIQALDALESCSVCEVSSIIETAPYGGVPQDNFKNGVLCMETILDPYQLLEKLHEIEKQADRVRDVRWGPRTLDLDILFYDDQVIQSQELTIPHVDMQNRVFVLQPLCEIAPWHRHPLLHQTVQQLYESLLKKQCTNNEVSS